MNKTELKHQVKDLYEVLNRLIEIAPDRVELVMKLVNLSEMVKEKLKNKSSVREIKRRKLTNKFVKGLHPFDIHEALNIEMKEARKKLKSFDFTIKEKNIILNRFSGNARYFIERYNGGVNS